MYISHLVHISTAATGSSVLGLFNLVDMGVKCHVTFELRSNAALQCQYEYRHPSTSITSRHVILVVGVVGVNESTLGGRSS